MLYYEVFYEKVGESVAKWGKVFYICCDYSQMGIVGRIY